MGVGAWILLITVGLGVPAALVYLLLLSIPAGATKSLPTRPVWMVLLDGGTASRVGRHDLDDDLDDEPNPRAPFSPHSGYEITRGDQQAMPEKAGGVGSMG